MNPAERRYTVEHETEYRYASHVVVAHHIAHLVPVSGDGQQVSDHELEVDPAPARIETSTDSYGNLRSYFSIVTAHDALRVRSSFRVAVRDRQPALDAAASPPWETVRRQLEYASDRPYLEAAEFSFRSPFVPCDARLRAYAAPSFEPRRPLLEATLDLMHRIHRDFRYAPATTHVGTPVLEAFAARRGVCQDFSHIMIGCLRSLGLAARYVSGYLSTTAAEASTRLLPEGEAAPAGYTPSQGDAQSQGSTQSQDPSQGGNQSQGSTQSQDQSQGGNQSQESTQSQDQSQGGTQSQGSTQSQDQSQGGTQSQGGNPAQGSTQSQGGNLSQGGSQSQGSNPSQDGAEVQGNAAPAAPPAARVNLPAMVGADASHAWLAVWCPVNGWVEFDPTNDVVPATGHVRLAQGRDYGDVAPLRGVVQGGGEHRLRVAVHVTPAA